MESDAAAVPGYVNRPTGHTPEPRARPVPDRRDGTRRTRLRTALVALRAYEQRAERRAMMRAWLIAQTAAAQ